MDEARRGPVPGGAGPFAWRDSLAEGDLRSTGVPLARDLTRGIPSHLADTSLPVASAPIHELDQVVVLTDVTGDEGETIREGSCGTVLSVLGDGAAYLVEFGSQSFSEAGYPISVFATIELEKLTPIPGATHADLASSATL